MQTKDNPFLNAVVWSLGKQSCRSELILVQNSIEAKDFFFHQSMKTLDKLYFNEL